jgi:hypothetical protein
LSDIAKEGMNGGKGMRKEERKKGRNGRGRKEIREGEWETRREDSLR